MNVHTTMPRRTLKRRELASLVSSALGKPAGRNIWKSITPTARVKRKSKLTVSESELRSLIAQTLGAKS